MLITPDIIKQLCPKLNQVRAINIAAAINSICPLYGISSADILHEFLARLLEECWEFSCFEENLNYSAEALIKTFGRHRISIEDCYRYGRTDKQHANGKEIANHIYGGEWGKKNLGNIYPDDGFNFRGSGPIQMTGRGNITAFAKWMDRKFKDVKTPEQWAEALRTSDIYGIHSACWLFAISKSLIDEAINDQLIEIVKKINGGLNGLFETQKYYEKCKLLIK
jgi:putative chitinase